MTVFLILLPKKLQAFKMSKLADVKRKCFVCYKIVGCLADVVYMLILSSFQHNVCYSSTLYELHIKIETFWGFS